MTAQASIHAQTPSPTTVFLTSSHFGGGYESGTDVDFVQLLEDIEDVRDAKATLEKYRKYGREAFLTFEELAAGDETAG